MKYILIFLTSLFAAAAAGQGRLPPVPVENLEGETVDVRSVLGDSLPVVVAFWSTACKPCLQELEAFAEHWEEWQQESRFKILAVSVDDTRSAAKVRSFVTANDWPFTVVLDKNQELKRAFNVHAIPHLYVVDANGNVVYSRIGYNPGSENRVLDVLKNL